MSRKIREALVRLLDAAIAAAQPGRVLAPALPDPLEGGRILVIGAGKAAAAMARAAEAHYRELDAQGRLAGAVATRHGHALTGGRIAVRQAGHPVPDGASQDAAREALDLAGSAGSDDTIVVLLSGGASAIWCAPVAGVSLADKQAVTRALLKSGARIRDINCVRKHLSRIKGGRLLEAARGRRLVTLAISDVPGDDPAVIGSGPTVADPSTLEEARAIVAGLGRDIPGAVTAALADDRNETLKAGGSALEKSQYRIVAAPALSLAAAGRQAEQLGYKVEILGDAIEGEARLIAQHHARLALAARAAGKRLALLSGGELTVTVTGAGTGGPNQEYALALALALGATPGIAAIAADTDGTDGGTGAPGDPAGAVVLPNTLERAISRTIDGKACLEDNDSTAFFRAVGDLVIKGPTQTNVNDFRAILIDP